MDWPLDTNLGRDRTVEPKNGSWIHPKRLDGVSPSHLRLAFSYMAGLRWERDSVEPLLSLTQKVIHYEQRTTSAI